MEALISQLLTINFLYLSLGIFFIAQLIKGFIKPLLSNFPKLIPYRRPVLHSMTVMVGIGLSLSSNLIAPQLITSIDKAVYGAMVGGICGFVFAIVKSQLQKLR